jgi:hypothetical protein
LGQLEPVRVCRVIDGEAAYVARCVARGQRAGAVKLVTLDGADDWSGWFNGPGAVAANWSSNGSRLI